jgi:hypothetical protein
MSGVPVLVARARLAEPLGECLPSALASADGTRDVGKTSVDSARLMGEEASARPNALQRQRLRLFQSQYEPGPRFFDAFVTELRCQDGRVDLEVAVSLFASENAANPEPLARRVDALVSYVVETCHAGAASLEPARRLTGAPPSCPADPRSNPASR